MNVSIRYLSLLAILAITLTACGAVPAAQPPTALPTSTAVSAPTQAPTTPALTAAPAPTAAPRSAPTVAVLDAPVANLTEGCVTDYNPEIDYFPKKVTLSDSAADHDLSASGIDPLPALIGLSRLCDTKNLERAAIIALPQLVYGVRAEVTPHPATGRLHVVFLPRCMEVSR